METQGAKKRQLVAKVIARAMLSRWPDREAMIEAAATAVGYRWTFLGPLADRIADLPRSSLRRLTGTICDDRGFLGVASGGAWPLPEETDAEALALGKRLEVRAIFVVRPVMSPAKPWPIPRIETEPELLDFLQLTPRELEQLTGHGRRDRRAPPGPLRNYLYHWRQKPGTYSSRLIESPKRRLKIIQRKILREILNHVPADEAAHGFRRGRSTVTHASAHAGKQVVLRMDLAEFFPSVSGGRVFALFRTIGYPDHVAQLLTALTTNATPADVLREPPAHTMGEWRRALLRSRHLPQGAPTSPAIASLSAYRLDRRLTGLARRFGVTYSRYADDLTFSGERTFASVAARFVAHVSAIASDEGFRVNHRKTRLMRAGVRQLVTGLVVNSHPNISRAEYERLKATLHNCVRHGPASQNRSNHPDFRAHLAGRLAYLKMVRPHRAEKLERAFATISWTS
jgi:RNA-directed DNA polymerase